MHSVEIGHRPNETGKVGPSNDERQTMRVLVRRGAYEHENDGAYRRNRRSSGVAHAHAGSPLRGGIILAVRGIKDRRAAGQRRRAEMDGRCGSVG
jgi:hypothetical protein